MTATQQLKTAVITYLTENEVDDAITIVDGKQRTEIELPTLAVEVASSDAHSAALHMVHNCELELTLRTHSGDEDDADVDSWIDRIESLLHDYSSLAATLSDAGITVYEILYQGSTQDWDEAVLETTFALSCVIQRQI